jgi:hypothetical protein
MGRYSPLFWTMVCNFVLPFPLLTIKRLGSITATVIASCGVVVGMWLERFLIIVPSCPIRERRIPGSLPASMAEIVIFSSSFAAMALFYLLFSNSFRSYPSGKMKVGEHPHIKVRLSPGSGSGRRTHMTGVYGLYSTPELAQQAVDGLRASGVPEHEITIQSSEPLEEYAFGSRSRYADAVDRRSGAAIGMATGYFDIDHSAGLADLHWRHADYNELVEPDHHLRTDDAGSGVCIRDHVDVLGKTSEAVTEVLRSRNIQWKDSDWGWESEKSNEWNTHFGQAAGVRRIQ